ncbi:MAG TPA: hypothetical protein DCS30_11520 [Rhizobiales bacterium]|uniref:Uncharacterized protein n=1 Tax=Cohaesibacter gelatinilyticus TaxID=372072 RepID=A0A285NE70_9HYPH|nr:hypothetical protein SAMN06265368_1246 [Cohaesibacter gelatinilyticus]HAT86507.1 hypothetical protein [Hyphomicrobiales bacterium]
MIDYRGKIAEAASDMQPNRLGLSRPFAVNFHLSAIFGTVYQNPRRDEPRIKQKQGLKGPEFHSLH